MEIIQPPSAETLGNDNKRHCIRIKARIKIHGEDRSSQPASSGGLPYQAYCETVTSSRPQSPDIFTTPPTHSEPFQPVQSSIAPTYTARIITRKRAVSKVSTSALSEHGAPSTESTTPTVSDSKHRVVFRQTLLDGVSASTNRHDTVTRTADPRDSCLDGIADIVSRNHTLSLSQVQRANNIPRVKPQITLVRTPLKQKRYGRTEYHPLPPLPPSPPDSPVNPPINKYDTNKTTVNFSRGEIKRKSPQPQDDASVPHLNCIDAYPPPQLPPVVHHPDHPQPATAEHERPPSKSSKRTVTFADDTTLSSRCSSPETYSPIPSQSLRQTQSPASDAQIPSSLRLYRSHDSLLIIPKALTGPSNSLSASRRTTPKDSMHKYTFGQRPDFTTLPPSPTVFARPNNGEYNPRLSTSKAQYRSLATLPRPLPSSLRVAAPQPGPRNPPWGSLECLEEQRGRRVDARERDQARVFRAQTLSEATTALGSVDGFDDAFGKEAMKREVEGLRKQVVGVYPDMAFDGSAGKGGRSCCCVVM